MSAAIYAAHAEYNYQTVAGHVPEGAALLDVGAWNCRVGALLAERRGCRVVNVDVVDKNETGLPLVLFDGRRLPLAAGSRDVVSLLYVLHHAPDDAVLLAEARRVVREGGRVLVAEDMVDSWWQRLVTVGFHVWLLLVTGMGWRGRFRRLGEWQGRFVAAGLRVASVHRLGPHMGKRLWPHNVLFVLEPARVVADGEGRARDGG